jgi:hypothetical protein
MSTRLLHFQPRSKSRHRVDRQTEAPRRDRRNSRLQGGIFDISGPDAEHAAHAFVRLGDLRRNARQRGGLQAPTLRSKLQFPTDTRPATGPPKVLSRVSVPIWAWGSRIVRAYGRAQLGTPIRSIRCLRRPIAASTRHAAFRALSFEIARCLRELRPVDIVKGIDVHDRISSALDHTRHDRNNSARLAHMEIGRLCSELVLARL